MPKTDGLTPRQQRFVGEYLLDLNATQAAVRAGYSARTAKQQGQRLLTKADIREAVEAATDARSVATGITAEYVLTTIRDTVESCRGDNPAAVLRGCELLGKHLKLFTEKHEHSGAVSVTFNMNFGQP